MAEDGASEPISTVTGGNKPFHRFLRGQPKSVGVVLITIGVGLFMFGIPMTMQTDMITSADIFTPFWLGILLCISGILYVLSERNPSKKIITASLALSIISTIGLVSACMDFIKSLFIMQHQDLSYSRDNLTDLEYFYLKQHYSAVLATECVFLCHSLIGGVLLLIMTGFSRAALRSSNTQAVVVMRNLSSAE